MTPRLLVREALDGVAVVVALARVMWRAGRDEEGTDRFTRRARQTYFRGLVPDVDDVPDEVTR